MVKFPININKIKYTVDDKTFFYDLDSGILIQVSPLLENILELIPKYEEDQIVNLLSEKFDRSSILQNIESLKQIIEKRNLFLPVTEVYKNKPKGKIQHLWLNVSHDCNLRCVYCYAEGGNYGEQKAMMTKETAKKCIDYWFKNLDKKKVSYVFFFGGEPLFNKEVIKYSINYINSLFKPVGRKAIYSMTTNGTIYDEEFTNLLAENNANLLFSIDGDKKIQDNNRPFSTGFGSYSKVIENMEKYKEKFNKMRASIVVTKITLPNLAESIKHLWDLGYNEVLFSLAITNDKKLSLTKDDFDELKKQIEIAIDQMMKNIDNREHKFMGQIMKYARCIHNGYMGEECSFTSNKAMMFIPNGEIHKCHRLIHDKNFALGSINDNSDWNEINKDFTEPVYKKKCKDCWALRLCGGGCPEEGYTYSNDINKPYDLTCELTKFLIMKSFEVYIKIYIKDSKLVSEMFKPIKDIR